MMLSVYTKHLCIVALCVACLLASKAKTEHYYPSQTSILHIENLAPVCFSLHIAVVVLT